MSKLPFNALPVLNDGFIGLVDHMGDDSAIVNAARISYGNDEREIKCISCGFEVSEKDEYGYYCRSCDMYADQDFKKKDRNLIRYLMRHRHTTPFEMVEFKFIVRVPMDCWRQWIRHRTANVNEYSTRYTEAINSMQETQTTEWRAQSTSNKQGSEGKITDGLRLSAAEATFHKKAREVYEQRIELGVAKEQARKDLPLSTYTEAYWKCDLHNIFHFLALRLHPHAQYEIRQYAEAMLKLIEPIVPVATEAFRDYRLGGGCFSAQEMNLIRGMLAAYEPYQSDEVEGLTKRETRELNQKLWPNQ